LEGEGATLLAGPDALEVLVERARGRALDLVVVSPGVPPSAALASVEALGIPILGEVELAYQELRGRAPVVAIGGTNGKSTTTALVHALLEAHGLKAFLGGNFGEPLATHVDEPWDVVVLEVSSFQMERVATFQPRVGVLLNVTADHLDRYSGMAAYAHAKGNCFARQSSTDRAVFLHGDEVCEGQARRGQGALVSFGPGGTVSVDDAAIVDTRRGERYLRKDMALTGGHNALNVAAAIAAVEPFGVQYATIRKVLGSFRGLPHRTALVGEIQGVRFYDDSKGTNVGAAVTALVGLTETKGVLVAGGRDKGGSYEPLVEALRRKGRGAVLLGEAADAMARALGDAVPWVKVSSMEEAVSAGFRLAEPGDAVLLSPACSSFDMFRDYKHRGDAFVAAVEALKRQAEMGRP
jgi:UDP-N-acetylmuramoylalanine--D-glutamate ligase